MSEIKGFTLTSLRAKVDQDNSRIEEADRIIEYSEQQSLKAQKYIKRSYYAVALNIALFFINVTVYPIPPFLNWTVVILILLNFGNAYRITRKARLKSEKFLKEQETYNLNTWGSKKHPKLLFLWDRTLDLYEVHVERDDESFMVGYIKEGDELLEGFDELEESEIQEEDI